jgi:hypothetical protein
MSFDLISEFLHGHFTKIWAGYDVGIPVCAHHENVSIFSDVVRVLVNGLIGRKVVYIDQAERIHKPGGMIRYISVQIDATRELDRIGRDVTACRRIIVPMPVVMQPGFRVNLLPLN